MSAYSKDNDTFCDAAEAGDVTTVMSFIKRLEINARGCNENTPLFAAVFGGHLSLAQLLIDRGAAVNVHCVNGTTPLQMAIMRGHLEIARLLLANGAEVNAKDSYGGTALSKALREKNSELVRLLAAYGAPVCDVSVLHAAVAAGDIELVTRALDKGIDVNAPEEIDEAELKTPLHRAPNHQIGEVLIDRGAKVNARTRQGRTPLHYANTYEFARLLIERGADVNAPDKDGKTPLDYAQKSDSADKQRILELLVHAGASVRDVAKTVEGLMADLDSRDYHMRSAAVTRVAAILQETPNVGDRGDIVNKLISMLRDPIADVRRTTVLAFCRDIKDRSAIAPMEMAAADAARDGQPHTQQWILNTIREGYGLDPPYTPTAAEMIKFACHCGARLKADRKYAGIRVKCPACGLEVAVPSGEGTVHGSR